jgi:outer membrane usher protein FimD/PapC
MVAPEGRAWHARRRPARLVPALVIALCVAASPAFAAAEETLRASQESFAADTIVVQITLNGVNKGQFFVNVVADDFLVRLQDLDAMGLVGLNAQTRTVDGEPSASLRSIAGLSVKFDERKLLLDLSADPKLLPKQTVDFATGKKLAVYYPTDTSAFLNYDLTYSGGNAGQRNDVLLANELGVRVGEFLFLSTSTYDPTAADRRFVRLMTNVTHDRRDTLERTVAGDVVASSGDLGALVNLGGFSYSKLYSIDPYFVRYPQQSITGQVRVPSEVDIYIDGQKVRTIRLPPGEFDLRNLTQSPGLRGVDIVIRDAFGREQRISTAYYSTDVPLKAGLQEYSYNIGALREMFGVESDRYGPLAFSAFHRYGVTDEITLGVRAEGKKDVYNAGPTASIVLGAAGLLNASAALSEKYGRGGGSALLSYSYVGRHLSAGLTLRKDSHNYATLADPVIDRRNYETNTSIGYSDPRLGSISAGYSIVKVYEGQDQKIASLNYSRSLFDNKASFFATLTNRHAQEKTNEIFVGLVYNLDRDYSISTHYQRFGETSTETIQLQKAQPLGEGLGYTVALEHEQAPQGTSTRLVPSFQYNSRWAILRADYAQASGSTGSVRSYEASVAGGIAMAGNTFSFGRPVTDSFGVVKVNEIEGVRVFVNSEEIGKTDASGRIFLPVLTSFYENQVSIDVSNVPLEYSFPESLKLVSPAFRSGAVIDFAAKRLQAITGTLKIKVKGAMQDAEFYEATLTVGGRPVRFMTGRGGEFYVEDLPPGRYAARLSGNGQGCAFELLVPQTKQAFTEIPEIVCDDGH